MRIIISPAKKMNVDTDGLPHEDLPQFLAETQILLQEMKQFDFAALKALWRCNDTITSLNYQRLQKMDLYNRLTPAVLSYEGIQYQRMAPGVFEVGQLDYIREHLRILSGFYGLLRPFDGVVPYRLEMQAKLRINNDKNLYEFWGGKLAKQLAAETDFILNLASQEYSKAVLQHLPASVKFLTCTFGEWHEGKVVEKGTLCKMARGEMVRWLAEHMVTKPEAVKNFNRLGYTYQDKLSNLTQYTFIRV